MNTNTLKVLNKGYVTLVDSMGSDLSVVNSARCSYMKKSDELTDKDIRLIKFLAREGHLSPFRHAVLQFELYTPLLVARQWFKYRIGSAHSEDTANNDEVIFTNNGDDDGFGDPIHGRNEASRRYITLTPEFYIPLPNEWRSKPENSKQGSGDNLSETTGKLLTEVLINQIDEGIKNYEWALGQGVAPEQARLFIPSAYGLYTAWYWTTSLQGVCHFLEQRLEHDAQSEIRDYARAVYYLAKQKFPVSIEELIK
jgi:thymidylate synthase (FAD)